MKFANLNAAEGMRTIMLAAQESCSANRETRTGCETTDRMRGYRSCIWARLNET